MSKLDTSIISKDYRCWSFIYDLG